jgi:uncharacterized damage-inducible protein DinB/ribosomal protein S18 acetylase RimI-like enzyme
MALDIPVRLLAARDSFESITQLLNRAYAPLAARGLNFTAATQDVETTKKRAAEGQCFVAERAGEVVGTLTVCGPFDVDTAPWTSEVPWFRDRDTAHLHQFAVDPGLQRQGLGRRLLQACEGWARSRGYKYIALDTAEPAAELRSLYRRHGYGEVGQVQWPGKHYRSVIMQKTLDRSPLREQLQTMARYNLWATRRLFEHIDGLSESEYRADRGLFFKSIHGTLNHLLVGEQLLWYRRFAEGQSPMLALDTEAEPDRVRLRERLLEGALAWLPLLSVWPEERLNGRLQYRRSTGEAMDLPFAATLAHVFNHGTHHRGQISAAITGLGRPCPELDLVYMLAQESKSA